MQACLVLHPRCVRAHVPVHPLIMCSGCKFRHRLEVIGKSEEPCKYDKACIAKACPSRHTTPLCSHPADCALPQCQSRHFAHLCKFKPCGNQSMALC